MTLQQLYNNDKEALAEMKKYLESFLREYGIAKMFALEDTKAVGEAKKILDDAFENLDTLFAGKTKKKIMRNEAR